MVGQPSKSHNLKIWNFTKLCWLQVVFASGNSPSESLMAHSVSVPVRQSVAPRIANSMPPNRRWSFSQEVS